MKSRFTEKIQTIFESLKKNRRLQILLLVALVLIVIVCYFCFSSKSKTKNSAQTEETNDTSTYVSYLETKLKNSLVNLSGVENVSVMITLESGFEYVYAMEEQTKQTASGTLTTTSLVLVSGEPVVVKQIYPVIKGVVVVSPSAKDINTRLNILSVIQTVLEITNDKITILN